jgi:CubicO group peptidase (beta-lactamase class C family)
MEVERMFELRNGAHQKFISAFFLCLLISVATQAQELPTAKPESLGLSSQRLEHIGTAVQRQIDSKRIAGAVTLVMRRGRVAWLQAQGEMDREASKPMRADTMFRICSMTKPITSAAVMMLYEQGLFLLEDPVSRYLPEFKNPKVLVKPASGQAYTIPATNEITIRDLLRHTSGLTYHWNSDLGSMYNSANVAHGLLPYNGNDSRQREEAGYGAAAFQPGRALGIQLGGGRSRCPGGSGFGKAAG